jgi:integrating conjugative element membrane protein (TIGR03747 family)
MSTTQAPAPRPAPSSGSGGPVVWALIFILGLIGTTFISWFLGVTIELIGCYSLWPDRCLSHSQEQVVEDLGYIEAAPKSILIPDTVGFATQVLEAAAWPYEYLKVRESYVRFAQIDLRELKGFRRALAVIGKDGTRIAMISMYVLQDTLLRMSIAAFALPAFVLACLLGAIDGLVRRDLRKWGGGRESSFIYHHAKKSATWACVGGFTLYLSWPFGGFNPAYMVMVFTVLVAFSLSTALASFKKYL